jgi:hypothetical protein
MTLTQQAMLPPELANLLTDEMGMRTIRRERWSKEQTREWIGDGPRLAAEEDITEVLTSSTVIVSPDGTPEVLYIRLNPDLFAALRGELDRHRKWEPHMRTAGMATVSLKFGVRPRTSFRTQKCETYALARENPRLHQLLLDTSDAVLPWYQWANEDIFNLHRDSVSKVHPAWQWSPVFTSGVANRDSQLPYHYDAGNFKSVWSGMLGLKDHISGGYLSVPEYGVGLEIADGSLTLFDGQGALHGVTPMRRTRTTGHRYTMVWYGMKGMWQCLDPAEEAQRANVLRTAREVRRAGR